MSHEARRLEFITRLKAHKLELAKQRPEGQPAPQMPRPLIDGVASMLATDEANTELAATFTESSKVMDQGAPDPLGAADIDAAISALEAMDPAAAAPPAPAPGA